MERRIKDRSDGKFLLEIFSVPKLLKSQNENILQKTFWQVSDRHLPQPLAVCSLASLISLFLGNPPGTLLESTKLLAPLPSSLAGSWLTGLLQLEIHNVLCEGNQKKTEERFSQKLWFGLRASGLSVSSGNTEPSDLEATSCGGRLPVFPKDELSDEWSKVGFPNSSVSKGHLVFPHQTVDRWACRRLSCLGTYLTRWLMSKLARELGSSSRKMIANFFPLLFFFLLNFSCAVKFAFFTLFPKSEWKIFKNVKVLDYWKLLFFYSLLHVYCYMVSSSISVEYKILESCHSFVSLDLWNQARKCPSFSPVGSHRGWQPPTVISYLPCSLSAVCSVTVNIINLLLILSWNCNFSWVLFLSGKPTKLIKKKEALNLLIQLLNNWEMLEFIWLCNYNSSPEVYILSNLFLPETRRMNL